MSHYHIAHSNLKTNAYTKSRKCTINSNLYFCLRQINVFLLILTFRKKARQLWETFSSSLFNDLWCDVVRATKFDTKFLTVVDLLMFGYFPHLVKQYFQLMQYLLEAYLQLTFRLILLWIQFELWMWKTFIYVETTILQIY